MALLNDEGNNEEKNNVVENLEKDEIKRLLLKNVTNLLVWQKVDKKCVVIRENKFTTGISYLKPGFHFNLPLLYKKKQVSLSPFPLDIVIAPDTNANTKEGIDVTGTATIVLEFDERTLNRNDNFYTLENVDVQVKKIANRMIRQLIRTYSYKDFQNSINVRLSDLIDSCGDPIYFDLNHVNTLRDIKEIYDKYGFRVINIDMSELNTKEISKLEEQTYQKEIELKQKKKEAQNNKEIEIINADAARIKAKGEADAISIKGGAEVDVLSLRGVTEAGNEALKQSYKTDYIDTLVQKMLAHNFTTEQIAAYLIREATNGKSIIVDNNRIEPATMFLAAQQLQSNDYENKNDMEQDDLENNYKKR